MSVPDLASWLQRLPGPSCHQLPWVPLTRGQQVRAVTSSTLIPLEPLWVPLTVASAPRGLSSSRWEAEVQEGGAPFSSWALPFARNRGINLSQAHAGLAPVPQGSESLGVIGLAEAVRR